MKFNIYGSTWNTKFEADPEVEGEAVDGYCDGEHEHLVIREGMGAKREAIAILHEVGHGVAFEIGIDHEKVPTWIEHVLVIGISKTLWENRKQVIEILSRDEGK